MERWLEKKTVTNLEQINSTPWAKVYRASLKSGLSVVLKIATTPNPSTFRLPELLSRQAPGVCPLLVASKPKRGFFLYEDLNLDRIEPQQELTRYAMLGPYAALQAKLATDAEFLAQIPRHLATTTLETTLALVNEASDGSPGNVFALMAADQRQAFAEMLSHHSARLRGMAGLIDAAPPTINHTDLNTGNAHIRASGQICLIDWDDAISSAPGWSLHMPFSGALAVYRAAQSLDDPGARDQATFALRLYTKALSRSGLYDVGELSKLLPATAAFGVLKYITDMAPYPLVGSRMENAVASFATRRLKDLNEMLDVMEAASSPAINAVSDLEPEAPAQLTIAFPEARIAGPAAGPVANPKDVRKAADLFRTNGALLIRDCIPTDLITAINTQLEQTWAEHEAAIASGGALRVGSKRYMISLGTKGALGRSEVLASPKLTAICDELLGSDFILSSMTTVVSLPGAQAQRWHCDNNALFPDAPEMETPPYSIAAILPLIELTAEIGATQIQPRSHRETQSAKNPMPYAVPDPKPGDCYIMDSRLMHRGLPNRSTTKRPILSLVYQRPWYNDYQNFKHQDALSVSEPVLAAFPEDRQSLIRWALKS